MTHPVITIENLGKKYRLNHRLGGQSYYSLREAVVEGSGYLVKRCWDTVRRPFIGGVPAGSLSPVEDFWALKDISLEINRGESVGIIGKNGAGKSTLLKILSRITEPTTGRFRLRGRLSSLLEVGTGFHSELTGKENIYLNGAILGMSRAEVRRKFDEIVHFAEVEKFLDTPVKRYSSGMYVRLAFAVAAHLEPEILVVDEVLAVGDAAFQKRCLGRMGEVASSGRTVLFVSHNMGAVLQLCPRSILLHNGRIVIELYPGIPDKTGERELIEAMKKGAFDLVVSSTGPLGAFSPSVNIVDIPYLFRDNAHADAVLDGPIGKALLTDIDRSGIKGLAFWENGFRHLTNARAAGRTCMEVKGLKIRVMENKVHVSAWKAAGLKPVAMAWGELHQALLKGEVDGQENPVAVFYSNKFWDVQKFFTLTHHVYSPAPLLMNKERFYAMPLTDRLLFMETAVEVAKLQRKGNRDAEEQKLKEIEANGVTVVRDVDRASYERAMAPAMAGWYKLFGKDRINAIIGTRVAPSTSKAGGATPS